VIHIKTITVEDATSWLLNEGHAHDDVVEILADQKALSALDILELDISAADKFWMVLREELIPIELLNEFACRCTENVLALALKTGYELDSSGQTAIDAKRKWLREELTDDELDAVWESGVSAAWITTRDTAPATARRVIKYAGWIAVRIAGKVAAREMTRCEILENLERVENEHLRILKEMLRGH